MAVPSGTYQTFQQIGIREDLSDTITMIDPMDVPFYSGCRKGKTKSRNPEWQKDGLANPNPNNATVEGDDATNDTATATERLRNYVQLFDKVVQVSSTAQAVDTAGRGNELKYQVAKRAKEMKRDIEMRLLGNHASTGGNASTAGELGGVEAWLETNVNRGASGADGGYDGSDVVAAATDGTGRTFTEALLKTTINNIWNAGGDPEMIMVSGTKKQTASGFAGIATQNKDYRGRSTERAVIMGAADLYISDFGEHRIVPNRFVGSADTGRSATNGLYPGQTALVLDMSKWEIKFLQPFKTEKLAKTGHSDRRMLSAELTLCSMDEAASGAVADLN